jgi:hypothetical protein
VKFIIEQLFLNDENGTPLRWSSEPAFHMSEADNGHQALSKFLDSCGATLLGDVSDFFGYQSIATARAGNRLFSVHVYPGTDTYLRAKAAAGARRRQESRTDESGPQRPEKR